MRTFYYALVLTAFIIVLAACSSGGNANSTASGAASAESSADTEIVIKTSNWKYDAAEYDLPANTPVKLTLENLEGAHGMQIVGTDIKIRQGKSAVVSLAPGTYDIECNIMCGTGHNQMKAKLVVS